MRRILHQRRTIDTRPRAHSIILVPGIDKYQTKREIHAKKKMIHNTITTANIPH